MCGVCVGGGTIMECGFCGECRDGGTQVCEVASV